MNEDDIYSLGTDTVVLGDYSDDSITIIGSDYASPLSTSLTNNYSYSLSPATINSGTVGATLSTTNTGSLLWNNPTYTATATPYANATIGSTTWTNYTQPQVLKVNGDAEFEGDVKIKGVNLTERLDAIEERLGILRPNNDLEGKWEKLKALGDEYRKLEKEILEGENVWDILKR